MKKHTKAWQASVVEAKQLLSMLRLGTKHRMRVAALALKTCEIFHGGRVDQDILTRKKFAVAIGINTKTLYEWIQIYQQIYLKLTSSQLEIADKQWIKVIDTRKNLHRKGSKFTANAVNQEFNRVTALTGGESKFDKYYMHIGALLYNAKNPRNMTFLSTEYIEKMVLRLTETAELLRKEVKFREKYGTFDNDRYKETEMPAKQAAEILQEKYL